MFSKYLFVIALLFGLFMPNYAYAQDDTPNIPHQAEVNILVEFYTLSGEKVDAAHAEYPRPEVQIFQYVDGEFTNFFSGVIPYGEETITFYDVPFGNYSMYTTYYRQVPPYMFYDCLFVNLIIDNFQEYYESACVLEFKTFLPDLDNEYK